MESLELFNQFDPQVWMLVENVVGLDTLACVEAIDILPEETVEHLLPRRIRF